MPWMLADVLLLLGNVCNSVQKPWAKPAGNPAAHVQRAVASETRPASTRAGRSPQRYSSLTTSLPALKIAQNVLPRQEAAGSPVVNPLALMDSGAAPAQILPSRQSSKVCAPSQMLSSTAELANKCSAQ